MNAAIKVCLVWVVLILMITHARFRGNTDGVWDRFSVEFTANTIKSVKDRERNLDVNVYYAIFAGRADLIKIHLLYTDMMLMLGLITEVHIWDFTNGNALDSEYISSFIRDTPLPGYKLFLKPSRHNYRGDFTHPGLSSAHKYLWYSFYEHYLTNERYRPHDILIKADDDISFIDISYFQTFINEITNWNGSNLHFPNIINNDVGFVVQEARIHVAAPELKKWMDYYTLDPYQTNFSRRFDDLYNLSLLLESSVNVEPITSWDHGTYKSGGFAFDMHKSFLRNPAAYLSELHASLLPKFIPLNERISINMYGGTFVVIHKLFQSFLYEHCCDDEGFIGSVPTFTKIPHIIHSDFVIVHYAFHSQDSDGTLLQKMRTCYHEMAEILMRSYRKARKKAKSLEG
jgi:hypothetical protein